MVFTSVFQSVLHAGWYILRNNTRVGYLGLGQVIRFFYSVQPLCPTVILSKIVSSMLLFRKPVTGNIFA